MRALIALAVVLAGPVAAQAEPELGPQARFIARDSGQLESDLFATTDRPTVARIDHTLLEPELLITVAVPARAAAAATDHLTVTVTQGKRTIRRTWKRLAFGRAPSLAVAHYALLVTPDFCVPMTIKARVGKRIVTRTIHFVCGW